MFNSHKEELDILRGQLQKIKKIDYADLDKFNAAFQKTIGFSYSKQKQKIAGTYTKFNSSEKHKFAMG